MNEDRIKEVLSDSEFTKSLLEMETPEEVQAALNEKGVELTIADIETIKQALEQPQDGELDDSALENVAGGSLTVAGALAIAAIIGASVGGAVTIGNKINSIFRRW